MRTCLAVSALLLSAAVCRADSGPWKMEDLRKPPKVTVARKGAVSSIYYEGEPYKGKATRVFAYLARPEKPEKKSPAMVLVHGGGGKAFEEWAKLWAKRGYVALAMDLAGCGPDGKRLDDGGPGQGDDTKFWVKGNDPKDFWTYHAVAAVIRGVSLLADLPDVDADRIGITGISWGGYLTCIVAGLDDRLKVAVPVYGCGFIHENSAWNGHFAKMDDGRKKLWVTNFEPSRYLKDAKMPMLFVNGTNDFAYPLDSYKKSYQLVKDRNLCVTVKMPHGHSQGWAPVEIGLFADQHLKKGVMVPVVGKIHDKGARVEYQLASQTKTISAALHYTTDEGPWQKREWKTVPLKVGEKSIVAELPKGRPLVYFVTFTDERKATISTEHVVIEKER